MGLEADANGNVSEGLEQWGIGRLTSGIHCAPIWERGEYAWWAGMGVWEKKLRDDLQSDYRSSKELPKLKSTAILTKSKPKLSQYWNIWFNQQGGCGGCWLMRRMGIRLVLSLPLAWDTNTAHSYSTHLSRKWTWPCLQGLDSLLESPIQLEYQQTRTYTWIKSSVGNIGLINMTNLFSIHPLSYPFRKYS